MEHVLHIVDMLMAWHNTKGFCWFSICAGGDGEANWFLPDILVKVQQSGETGVVKEVLPVLIRNSIS